MLEKLFARRTFGVKLGLETELALLDALGNPHESLAVVHVAGTNGKGSVCAMLESVCRVAGLVTGLYTSPHLVRFNERFRVGGRAIPDDMLVPLLARVEEACDRVTTETGNEPTFFEAATAIAFCHFRDAETDVAMIETGLGGRLDATNVVTPLLSIITRIATDHTRHLGESLEAIASEKCGIIKSGRPVVCGRQVAEAKSAIVAASEVMDNPCIYAEDTVSVSVKAESWEGQKCTLESAECSYGTVNLPLLGRHQMENVATATCAAEQLAAVGLPLSAPAVLKQGLECVSWPGRCQLLKQDPVVLLDGAHNPSAMQQLGQVLKSLAGKSQIGLVCGFCDDKDVSGCLDCLPQSIAKAWTVPVRSERSMDAQALCSIIEAHGVSCSATSLSESLEQAERWAIENDGVVVITGSLFLAGEVLEVLKIEN